MWIWFNTTHHEEGEKKNPVHVHADGKKHMHQAGEADKESVKIIQQAKGNHHHDEAENKVSSHQHTGAQKNHHHDEAAEQQQDKNGDSEKDDCCHDKVVKIFQADKAVINTHVLLHPVFFTYFVSVYYNIDVTSASQITPCTKYFVRGHHPPIPDIRIAIQSFQI